MATLAFEINKDEYVLAPGVGEGNCVYVRGQSKIRLHFGSSAPEKSTNNYTDAYHRNGIAGRTDSMYLMLDPRDANDTAEVVRLA